MAPTSSSKTSPCRRGFAGPHRMGLRLYLSQSRIMNGVCQFCNDHLDKQIRIHKCPAKAVNETITLPAAIFNAACTRLDSFMQVIAGKELPTCQFRVPASPFAHARACFRACSWLTQSCHSMLLATLTLPGGECLLPRAVFRWDRISGSLGQYFKQMIWQHSNSGRHIAASALKIGSGHFLIMDGSRLAPLCMHHIYKRADRCPVIKHKITRQGRSHTVDLQRILILRCLLQAAPQQAALPPQSNAPPASSPGSALGPISTSPAAAPSGAQTQAPAPAPSAPVLPIPQASSSNTGAIVGGAVGGAAVAIALAGLIFCLVRRRVRKAAGSTLEDDNPWAVKEVSI